MPPKIDVSSADPREVSVDLLAVPVVAGADAKREPLGPLDEALQGILAQSIEREEYKAKKDELLETATLGRLGARRLVLIGMGDEKPKEASLRALGARAARAAVSAKARSLAVLVPKGVGGDRLRFLSEGVTLGSYKFTKYLTGERRPKVELGSATLVLPAKSESLRADKHAVDLGRKVAEAVCLARDLVSEPPNELFPAQLADEARRLAKVHGLTCQVFDRREIETRGMKLLAAVGRGSSREPRFIHLKHGPKQARHKVVLVGKGLTFDSGGLCIKPAAGMGEMKTDMAGAATVLGAICACAAAAIPVEVHALIAAAENMPDGDAYRPGDVFGSLSGQTVEIVNTDAEGRLVLADALTYATSLKPDLMIDLATLTGACVVALGKTCSGFYATDDKLATQFAQAAKTAGEQFWRMPLLDDLKEQLKSDIADLKHTGDRWGGSITAALFLKEFVGRTPWIHADIAGPVWADHASGFYTKGATGHGVLTLLAMMDELSRQK